MKLFADTAETLVFVPHDLYWTIGILLILGGPLFLLWKSSTSHQKEFNVHKEKFLQFQLEASSSLASLTTFSKGRFVTHDSPLTITKDGNDLLDEIHFNDFLQQNYTSLKNHMDSKENLENKIDYKKEIDSLFFSGDYTEDRDFKNNIANVAYDKGVNEKELVFLMSKSFERKYFDERFPEAQNSKPIQ